MALAGATGNCNLQYPAPFCLHDLSRNAILLHVIGAFRSRQDETTLGGEDMSTATVIDTGTLPAMLRVEQLQDLLRMSRPTAYGLIHTVGFPTVRVGRLVCIPREALLRWLESQVTASSAAVG